MNLQFISSGVRQKRKEGSSVNSLYLKIGDKEYKYDFTSTISTAKLSIKLFIYKYGPTHEEMEDVL